MLLELKMLAEVGLIGFPNVGKSSILSEISSAKPKIANYHFTTLSPNLGVVRTAGERGFVAADIPGLIEGAADGAGLGHAFLRHVERCRLLLHVVDISCFEGRDPIDDIEKINYELARYSASLAERPQIILANKVDSLDPEVVDVEAFESYVRANGWELKYISAVTGEGLDRLEDAVTKLFPAGDGADSGSLLTDARQEDAVTRALAAIRRAQASMAAGLTPDAILTDAEEALNAVGELTGHTAREEIVGAIFSRFCVGK